MSSIYAELVDRDGLSEAHQLVLEAVPSRSRVLDVGCATGYLSRELHARGCEVVGVEADIGAAREAAGHCAAVVAGNIEDPAVRARLQGPFDAVLFADVLEHLRDPAGTLRFVRDLVLADGRAVVSLPNIAHWTGRRMVLGGRFPYADHGLFDRTHLRFFTRASARELAARAGWEVAAEAFASAPLPLEAKLRRTGETASAGPGLRRLRRALTGRWPELFALQLVLTLRPVAGDR